MHKFIFLLSFLLTYLPALFSSDEGINALASLSFYLESHKLAHGASDSILFSDEQVEVLWIKSSNAISKGHISAFEKARNNYYLAQQHIQNCNSQRAKYYLSKSSDRIYNLWVHAIKPFETRDGSDSLNENYKIRSTKDIFSQCKFIPEEIKSQMRPYTIPMDHKVKLKLDKIFLKNRVTQDAQAFEAAGFKPIGNLTQPRSFITVATHKLLPGHLVKVYFDTELREKKEKPSWRWLVDRCKGAAKIRYIIAHKKIRYFTVPNKWLYPLPANPAPPDGPAFTRHLAILLVTDMRLAPMPLNFKAWQDYISKKHLDELYYIISRAKGSSYRPDNIRYTLNGTFAFIDTEYPNRGPDFLSIRKYLRQEMVAYWDYIVSSGGTTL